MDEADRDIARISAEGARTAEHDLWQRLNRSSLDFSREARRLLAVEDPETFSSIDLFRFHEAFVTVVARLIEAEYRKLNAAQAQIERRTSRLPRVSLLFAARQPGSGADLHGAHGAHGLAADPAAWSGRPPNWAASPGTCWKIRKRPRAASRTNCTTNSAQSLTAVKTNLSALGPASATRESGRLADCLHLVDEAIGNVRQMSQLLRPTILDDFGLEAGLRWLAEGFAARTGIEVEVDSTYSGRLPDETETHLFRIAQEALTNIARHSGARHVEVQLLAEPARRLRSPIAGRRPRT